MKDPRLKVGFDLTPATMLALYKGQLHIPDFGSLPYSKQAEQEIKHYEEIISNIKKEQSNGN